MEYQGAITLSKDEQRTLAVVQKFRSGLYTRVEAALKLNLSIRQISRIAKKLREQGIRGVKHGNCGKPAKNKIPESLVTSYVDLYKEKYFKFNYSHALEMIAMNEELIKLSYTRFRKACRKLGIGKVKKRRTSKSRVARERYAEEGYMWQLDGSPELWDGRETTTLIGLIDDATSKIPGACLYPSETTWACMNVTRKAIEENGCPEFILTDKAGWSEGSGRKRQHFSQFERACLQLDITVIATPSAEAKGRIERLNRTFQDRLIPELDLFGITGLKDSNRYIEQVFIPGWHDKFTVEPQKHTTRYRAVAKHIDLREVFCIHEERIVNRDHTVCYDGKKYVIQPNPGKNYKGKEVTIHEYEDKTISIFYGQNKLISKEVIVPVRNWKKVG